MVVALLVAGCSAASGQPASAVAKTSAAVNPRTPPSGTASGTRRSAVSTVVDTNPSDPPLAMSTQSAPPGGYRVAPPAQSLPTGWDSAAWIGQAHTAAGSGATEDSHFAGAGRSVRGWTWHASAVRQLEVGAVLDAQSNPVSLYCNAQGFSPGDSQAARQISAAFALCGSAPVPDGDSSGAGAWVARQVQPMLADLAGLHSGNVRSSSPRFGAETYYLEAFYAATYGYTIELTVM